MNFDNAHLHRASVYHDHRKTLENLIHMTKVNFRACNYGKQEVHFLDLETR